MVNYSLSLELIPQHMRFIEVSRAKGDPMMIHACASVAADISTPKLLQQCLKTRLSSKMPAEKISLPVRWESALAQFERSQIMPRYLGEEYHRIYTLVKSDECDDYHARISPLDYECYLRAV